MGQQQLLLIVLGVIIVGIAIYGGIRLMDAYNQGNDRDMLIHQMHAIVSDAKQYAFKPNYLGGGDGSLAGYQPPRSMSTTDRFRIYVGSTSGSVTLTGYGTVIGEDRQSPVEVLLTYTSSDGQVTSVVIN